MNKQSPVKVLVTLVIEYQGVGRREARALVQDALRRLRETGELTRYSAAKVKRFAKTVQIEKA